MELAKADRSESAPARQRGEGAEEARPLAILLLEDNVLDAELIEERLRSAGMACEVTRVEGRDDYVGALERGGVDLILADFSLPSYDGLSALEARNRAAPDVPFVFVSGALGEELAIETLRRGATDYVLKHRLDRLVPAVWRARKEAEDRAARRRAEAERDRLLVLEREARREAEEANRTKDEFLAVLSHELRTPLNAILGWLHLLRTGALPEERRARALETIERNAKAQAELVEDLLDLSRIISGKLRIEARSVDLGAVIEAAVDTVRPAAKAKGIALSVSLDPGAPRILGDPYRLQQVVWNLVSNAIKFTPASGRVAVRLSPTAGGEGAEICVSDTGAGIDPDFLPHVFERFRQAEGALGRKHGGLGLGLAIVSHMVELHGGAVRAESPGRGQGASFFVTLPARREEGPESAFVAAPPSSAFEVGQPSRLGGLLALVVDDEADAREMLSTLLEQHGLRVTAVGSAEEALAAMEREAPDVLISDIGMPVVDGYELIRKVRALEGARGKRIPAIALTGYARGEDSQSALSAGFHKHVSKPVDPAHLFRALERLMARASR